MERRDRRPEVGASPESTLVAQLLNAAVRAFRVRRTYWSWKELERAKGIEPSYEAWEASVLPLNYARLSPALPRKPRLPARALTRPRTKRPSAGDGRRGETRTRNPRFWRPVLCQLSYTPSKPVHAALRALLQGLQGRRRPRRTRSAASSALTSPPSVASFRRRRRAAAFSQGWNAQLPQFRNAGRRHRRPH